VTYKSNSACFVSIGIDQRPAPPFLIAPTFQPDGHTYRQLTPDGVLK
jgi:hypothetical protein